MARRDKLAVSTGRHAEIQYQEVDNPYFAPEHAAGRTNPKKVTAAINVRESAIETLYARGQVDQAQKRAADRFRAIWEAMGGAGARALDYSREVVDGGGAVEPIKDHQLNAGQELNRCRKLLGARGYDLVCKVCGEGYALGELCDTKRDRLTAADNLRAHLDDLCEIWGLASKTPYRKTA